MVDTKSLDKIVERGYLLRSLLEKTKCIMEIQPGSHIAECSEYGTKYCLSSKYREQCNYAKEKDVNSKSS